MSDDFDLNAQALITTLDALEDMVNQHFAHMPDGELCDNALSANEDAAEVLANFRPDRWELTARGLRQKPDHADHPHNNTQGEHG